MTRLLRLLVGGSIAVMLAFPPWAQDNPAPQPSDFWGSKTSNGHSFILHRPPPVSPKISAFAPPTTVPVEIDVAEWIRELLTVVVVMGIAARCLVRSALNPRVRGQWSFGRQTFAVALLWGLIMPVPLSGPVSFEPWWRLTDSNHGIPGWFFDVVIWIFVSLGIYLTLGLIAFIIQRVTRARAGQERAPA